jgi:hypothetical protein
MKPTILVTAGCSWTFGKNVVRERGFPQLLQRKFDFTKLCNLAENGSNNETQLRKLTRFVDENRDKYSKIFVLWGLTSIYRWEMYSSITDQVEACMAGKYTTNQDLGNEIKYYFSHFFDKDYELAKLGEQIILLNGYLKNLGINHLIFNCFQSYNNKDLQINNIDEKYFYRVKEQNNDILSLLCQTADIKISTSSVPWLNLMKYPDEYQYNNNSIKELQNQGWLDLIDAHPTIEAHKLIANELYDYIKDKNNERI